MKIIFLSISFLIVMLPLFSQLQKPDDFVKFKQKEKDFGKIKQGKPVSFEFAFDNISNGDVIIEEVIPPSYPIEKVK